MTSRSFKYTAYAVGILQKIIGSRFTVSGLENLPKDQPIVFVANHFTRSETIFVPYLIHKYTSRQVRSLADSSLYKGFLGRFLTNVGTVSTKDEFRDRTIIKDLVKNDYDWLIYPEGSMVKSKKIEKKSLYISHTPYRTGPVRTGSAVLALKSHLYRRDIIEAHENNKTDILNYFEKGFNLKYSDDLRKWSTYVVPLSITYYPIRPGQNKLELFARKKIEKISPRLAEELQIEGNLLQDSQIDLHFGKPISLFQYIKGTRGLIYQIPIIKNDTKTNFVIKYFKHRLTNDMMKTIYSGLKINLDHIFSAAIRHIKTQEIDIIDLKRIIYISALMIEKTKKYRLNQSIKEENLYKIFSDEPNHCFDSVFELAKNSGEIVQISDSRIKINKRALFAEFDFHKVRIENTLQVIFNEFSLLENATNIVRRNSKLKKKDLRAKTLKLLLENDVMNFEKDYAKYYDSEHSKAKNVGCPYFIEPSKKRNKNKVGILLCHGYKSSPKEVEALAKFLQKSGYYVYAVRLKGHGTSPKNMLDICWQDWHDSFNRGYAYLRNYTNEISFIGFSTGALISLYSASCKKSNIKSVISINAALRLKDIRSKFVPAINLWNDLLEKFKIEKAKFEYVEDDPEYPDFNYRRNYLHGVEELGKLMEKCEKNLEKVKAPAFVIQAKNDPVISSKSGKLVYDNISSAIKEIYEPDLDNHVIINGKNKEKIFAKIEDFLQKI